MELFEIEDIVTQDKHGIVFRGRLADTGELVAIRRFFPFGKDGGGLENEEGVAYEIAAKRLATVEHVCLRSVIRGGVDPIDAMPFLVTQWVEGDSLKAVLADETLDPALVIDVLRIALEVSVVLSQVLGEEAVWVETDVSSIVVGNQESGRGFTFWISPMKWLGSQHEERKLSSIATLGEELLGWRKKLVSDQAGYGLGGWLKWLRANSEGSLEEALDMLTACTATEPPPTGTTPVRVPTKPTSPQLKQTSSKTPLLITAAIALITTVAALTYLHMTAKPPAIAAEYKEQKISKVIVEKPDADTASPTSAPDAPKPGTPATDDATAKVNALAEKMSRESLEASRKQQEQDDELKAELDARGGIFTPQDGALLKPMPSNKPVKLRGVLASTNASGSGKSIYLNFSEPLDKSLVKGVLHQRDFKGKFALEEFAKYLGKSLVLDGKSFREPTSGVLVKITSFDQISVEK